MLMFSCIPSFLNVVFDVFAVPGYASFLVSRIAYATRKISALQIRILSNGRLWCRCIRYFLSFSYVGFLVFIVYQLGQWPGWGTAAHISPINCPSISHEVISHSPQYCKVIAQPTPTEWIHNICHVFFALGSIMPDIDGVLPYSIPPYHAYSTIAFAVSLRKCKLETNPQIHHYYDRLRLRNAFLSPMSYFFIFLFLPHSAYPRRTDRSYSRRYSFLALKDIPSSYDLFHIF